MNDKPEPYCCKIGCEKPAEYEIWSGSRPEDCTHACTEHIPDLLTDGAHHSVTKLGGAP